MIPVPNITENLIPEAQKWRQLGSHRRLYTFSPADYGDVSGIWSGPMDWDDNGELEVVAGTPEGAEGARCWGVARQFLAGLCPGRDL